MAKIWSKPASGSPAKLASCASDGLNACKATRSEEITMSSA